jgi:drug/metabolite transporter (DMT)-like permease
MVELRIGMAAVLLALVAWATSRPLRLRQQWRQIVVLGAVNTAVPFFLQAYAAKTLNASVLSVLNATAPVFGAVVGALWLREALSLRAGLGLALGIGGVAVIVSADLLHSAMPTALPVLAALGTSLAYAVASNYARRHARTLDHFNSAHGSLWIALLMILPAVPGAAPPGPIEAGHAAAAVALGIVCTGIAYLLYFKLIRDVGPTSALTVAYLIPVFGVLWGVVLLGEPLTPTLLAGGAMVIAGTALITGFGVARLGLASREGD